MARARPNATLTTRFPLPTWGPVDLAPWIRTTQDLMARSGRLWVDLWFRNLELATDVFWAQVRDRGAR
jgi:hypothetical protein